MAYEKLLWLQELVRPPISREKEINFFSIVTSDLSIRIAFVSQQINSDIALLLKMFGSFRGKVETASRKTDISVG